LVKKQGGKGLAIVGAAPAPGGQRAAARFERGLPPWPRRAAEPGSAAALFVSITIPFSENPVDRIKTLTARRTLININSRLASLQAELRSNKDAL